jgi:hypothetical protein
MLSLRCLYRLFCIVLRKKLSILVLLSLVSSSAELHPKHIHPKHHTANSSRWDVEMSVVITGDLCSILSYHHYNILIPPGLNITFSTGHCHLQKDHTKTTHSPTFIEGEGVDIRKERRRSAVQLRYFMYHER